MTDYVPDGLTHIQVTACAKREAAQHVTPYPGQVHRVVQFDPNADDYGDGNDEREVASTDYRANVATSEVKDAVNTHKLLVDIDFPCKLIPSSTPGHFHLFIDKMISKYSLENILQAMANAGIVEHGYANAAIERGYTAVRLPWVNKGDTNGSADAMPDTRC